MSNQTNIFLVGPMGAGKTTVGRRLARLRDMQFVDSDHELEQRTGVDIPVIFEYEGEAGFRKREARMLEELTARTGIVLATGGGIVLDPANRGLLQSRGSVVFLRATVEQQLERTRHSRNRPLLDTDDRRARLESLATERDPLYQAVADLIIATSKSRAQNTARRVDRELKRVQSESAARETGDCVE